MKKLIAALLCVTMLLALCGCSKEEKTEERPKLEISGTTQGKGKNGEERPQLDIGRTPQNEEENKKEDAEQTEEAVAPVTLMDNEYCTIIQNYIGDGLYELDVTNKSDGTLKVEAGYRCYINDVYWVGWPPYNYDTIEASESTFLQLLIPISDDEPWRKVEISLSVNYKNNLSGVYAESCEVFNGLVSLYNSGDPVPEKYVSTGKEMDVIDTGDFKITATQCSIDDFRPYNNLEGFNSIGSSYAEDYYLMQLYFENNTDDYITFYLADPVTMTSDIQENVGKLCRRGGDTGIQSTVLYYTVDPGKGCYLPIAFSKTGNLNNYAIDRNEVVTIHFPIRVNYILDEIPDYEYGLGKYEIEGETYTLTFTRDQLVNN